MDRLKKLWRFLTARETLLYLVFGVLTTLINIVVFDRFYYAVHWSWQAANVAAWVLAVLFAFLTNKLFVFQSKSFRTGVLFHECAGFFAARLLSLGVDMLCLKLLIDILAWNGLLAKITDNVLVVIINYILSKFFVFTKK